MQPKLEAAFQNVPVLPGIQKLVDHLTRHKIPMAVSREHRSGGAAGRLLVSLAARTVETLHFGLADTFCSRRLPLAASD